MTLETKMKYKPTIMDKEIASRLICYCHFSLTKMWNESFVLAQNQTIVNGNPYCEDVFHETRIVDEIEHPSKEFFGNLEKKNNKRNYLR